MKVLNNYLKQFTILILLVTTFTLATTNNEILKLDSQFDVYLYDSKDGLGRNQLISISNSGNCTSVPDDWQNSVGAVGLEIYCVRFWQESGCQGKVSRCYCDSRFLSLDENFRVSKESSWNSQIRGLSSCYSMANGFEDEKVKNEVSLAWLFSQQDFKGNLTTIVLEKPGECFSFPEGDKWHGYGRSAWLFQGCVEYYEEEGCTGKSVVSSKEQENIRKFLLHLVKSARNCVKDDGIVSRNLTLPSNNENHGVGAFIYPKGFAHGLPWASRASSSG